MNFFQWLFGANTTKPEPAAAPGAPPQTTTSEEDKNAEKKLKIEAALNNLDAKIRNFEEKERRFENKIEILKEKAKELLAADKKKEAKKFVEEITKVQKQAENYTLRKKVLVEKKFQLEQALMDMETIEALDSVEGQLKEQAKNADRLQDLILDGKEAKVRQDEIDNLLRNMVDNDSDDEEVDDMLDQLLKEVKQEKKPKLPVPNNVKIPAKKEELGSIEDMMANL